MSAQQLWLDNSNRNGTYGQPFVNIRGQVDGVDEVNEIRYELRVSVVSRLVNSDPHWFQVDDR